MVVTTTGKGARPMKLFGQALRASNRAQEEGRLYWRVSDSTGRACNGGAGKVTPASPGKPGPWSEYVPDPVLCREGWHATSDPIRWQGSRLALVEVDCVVARDADKVVCLQLRELAVVDEAVDARLWVAAHRPHLSRANLFGADLSEADLHGADLSRANLRGANLRGADLSRANLCGAHLREADLRVAELRGADLSGANLRGANLSGADLSRANLFGADLSEADLHGANLCGAHLRGADLSRANLRGAYLCGADLCGANLRGAHLRGAHLRGADLRGADLCGAVGVKK